MNHPHHHTHTSHHEHAHEHSHSYQLAHNPLKWPLLLTLAYAFIEAFSGWLTGSLTLLSDAGHMFSDSAALGLAWFGAWIALKPASKQHSFGFVRAEIVVAFVNGLAMLLVVMLIVIEAFARFKSPQTVPGLSVMIVAFFGLIINLVVAKQLHQDQHSLNSRAALVHVMGDLLGSIAAILAGAIIYFTGWQMVDPLLSLLISGLILFSTYKLLREALHVLMEGVPLHLEIPIIKSAMSDMPHVHEVHSLHVWALSSDKVALSAHIVLDDLTHWHEVLNSLRTILHEHFDIDHITLQPETVQALNDGEIGCWLTQKTS